MIPPIATSLKPQPFASDIGEALDHVRHDRLITGAVQHGLGALDVGCGLVPNYFEASLAGDVLVKADLVGVVLGIQNGAHGFRLPNLLALGALQLRQSAAFADGDEIKPVVWPSASTTRFCSIPLAPMLAASASI